jgi:hypothetical protein
MTELADRTGSLRRRRARGRSTIAVARRDRPWVDAYVAGLCGPLTPPPIDDLRRAVTTLADRYPQCRLSWGLDAARRHWKIDDDIESIVVEHGSHHDLPVGRVLDAIASDETLRTPFALIRFPRALGFKMSHSLGDGGIFTSVFPALLMTAMSGDPYPWPFIPGPRFPLALTVCRTFGRNPTLIRKAIGDRPTEHADAPAGTQVPWQPSRRTLFAGIPTGRFDEIEGWAKQFAPGAGRIALQMTLIMRSLRRCGLPVQSNIGLLVDLRRYRGPGPIDGNFAAGVPLRFDSSDSPAALSASIRATLASARPLATQVLTTLRRGGPGVPPSTVDSHGVPQVTFTALRARQETDGLPFLPDGPVTYTGSVEPAGPLGITFLIVETSNITAITACFHDNAINPEIVEAALRLVESAPFDLLTETDAH